MGTGGDYKVCVTNIPAVSTVTLSLNDPLTMFTVQVYVTGMDGNVENRCLRMLLVGLPTIVTFPNASAVGLPLISQVMLCTGSVELQNTLIPLVVVDIVVLKPMPIFSIPDIVEAGGL